MTLSASAELLLADPLTIITRQTRTRLVAFSVLGVVIEKTGLVPTQIEGLGVVFEASHRASLVSILLLAIIYFTIAFLVYALSDFSKWQLSLRAALLPEKAIENRAILFAELNKETGSTVLEPVDSSIREAAAKAKLDKALHEAMRRYMRPYWQGASVLGCLRALLEFIFPVVLGAYALFLLTRLLCAL